MIRINAVIFRGIIKMKLAMLPLTFAHSKLPTRHCIVLYAKRLILINLHFPCHFQAPLRL